MKIRKTVGIDLGTTNSVIALMDPTDSALLTGRDEQGHPTFPSLVGHHPEQDRPLVCRAALPFKGGYPGADTPGSPIAPGSPNTPGSPVASIKRFMGLDRLFPVGPEQLTAQQVSARILAHLREVMARTLNDSRHLLDAAIITMPAYFNHNQIEATRQAGELAGYEVVELLHEPTAAAIYYGWLEDHGDATYLVYDLGGGTFDVSIIRKRFGDFEVLSVSGDPFLGGDDFDRLLASAIGDRLSAAGQKPGFSEKPGFSPGEDFARLVHVAEQVKITLSTQPQVDITEYLRAAGWPAAGSRPPIAVSEFNRLIKDKVDRTIDCCHEALALARDKAGIRLSDIDYVVLVGGSSRVPLVREAVRAAFCNPNLPERVKSPEPLLDEPDLCVAYGAALRAATHGTRYLFDDLQRPRSFLPDLDFGTGADEPTLELELHLTSPMNVRDTAYTLTGCVRGHGAAEVRHGGSVRVHALAASPLTPVLGGEGRTRFTRRSWSRTAASARTWSCCPRPTTPLSWP